MEAEIWKDIDGYDGLYQISNLGNVRSLKFGKIKLLKQINDKYGYKKVDLYKDRKTKTCKIHRLVAQAFIPNPNNLPEVNHKDENKSNNCVDNLEWCDRKYNMNYGTAQQRSSCKRINHPSRSKQVLQLTKSGEFVTEYPSICEASRFTELDKSHISKCCRGIKKSFGGFIWKYKNEE